MERKKKMAQMVSFLRQPRSLKQRRLNAKRWPGSFSGPVTGDGFIGGRVLQSGCLDNQRLSQALALQKRKKKLLRVYTTITFGFY